MSNARNLADIVTGNFDVPLGALDNVPPSNDASALTTGTLPIARIADGVISSDKLASGAAKANFGSGAILQTHQFSYSGVYENTAQSTEYNIPSPLGDGSANITLASSSNKILIRAVIHCGQEDTWRANYFKIYYSIGGGSWTMLTNGGFASIVYISGTNGAMGTASTEVLTVGWNTTANIRFKITQIGHANGGYFHMNQNNFTNSTDANNQVSAASSITLQEIQS